MNYSKAILLMIGTSGRQYSLELSTKGNPKQTVDDVVNKLFEGKSIPLNDYKFVQITAIETFEIRNRETITE